MSKKFNRTSETEKPELRTYDPDVEESRLTERRQERLSRKKKERRNKDDFDDNWN